MHKLFVYGTLRKGNRNYFYLNRAPCVFKQCWVNGSLYDTGRGYPVLLRNDDSGYVYGELYEVTEEQLKKIDHLEGYVENGSGNLYDRERINVVNEQGEEIEALSYFGGESLVESDDKIETGDWNVYTYLKQSDLLYFAYGSCMDDERFILHGVDHHFKRVVGCGLLEGYELQFSRSSSDGGKADIVESFNEKVEGKVYQVPLDAITYLYEREGVYTNAYRPIIIDIVINGQPKRAITFIGTQKEAETAPTVKYASEIIRGSTGFLSEWYVDLLQKKINFLFKE